MVTGPTKSWEALFLVDTGAVDCLVPGKHLRALGLKPRGKRLYELADGSEVTLDITVAEIEFMGETVGATLTFGPDDAEPILGMTALESVGIEVDPRSQRLNRLPAVLNVGDRAGPEADDGEQRGRSSRRPGHHPLAARASRDDSADSPSASCDQEAESIPAPSLNGGAPAG